MNIRFGRTIKRAIILAASATGTMTATAQSNVYALNVVGYVNIAIPANQYVMIANQLNTTNNTIASLLPNPPDGTILSKFDNVFHAYALDDAVGAWTPDGDATLNPGEGCFFKSPLATTLTFVGEIRQGTLTNTLPIGQYVIRSSIVPQAANPTVLGVPAEDGDILQLFHGKYSAYVY